MDNFPERAVKDVERHRAILEALQGLLYVAGPDLRIEFANKRLIERVGRDVHGEFCYKAIHGRHSACPWCVSRRVFSGDAVRFEFLNRKDDRWYSVVNTPIRNPDGSSSKLSFITEMNPKEREAAPRESAQSPFSPLEQASDGFFSVDLSGSVTGERDCAEESNYRPNQEFRTLVQNAPDIIVRFDRQLRLTYVNPILAKLTGVPCAAFLGKTHRELGMPPAFCELWKEKLMEAFGGVKDVDFDFDYAGSHGLLHLHARLVPELTPAGSVESVISITRDMTEVKSAEIALRNARDKAQAAQEAAEQHAENLATLMDTVPTAILMAHDPLCRSVTGNRAAEEVYEVGPHVNISQTPAPGVQTPRFRYFSEGCELQPQELPLQRAAALNTEIRDQEMELVLPDGTRKILFGHASPLRNAQDEVRGCLAAYVDITRLRRTEKEMEQAKEAAEAANRAKDEFFAILSHELRTPLTPVLTAVQIMEADETITPHQRQWTAIIRRNVELEARLIDDLLDVNRVVRGKMKLCLAPVELHGILDHVLQTCESDIRAKNLEIAVQFTAPTAIVRGDASRLQQVFWNILKNAVKFTPEGGRITIRTEPRSARRIAVAVTDTGIGIDPAFLPKIFNAFEQGAATTTSRFGGLGLGLAICKGVVELHGGAIEALSLGRDCGTTIIVELDTDRTAVAQSAAAPDFSVPAAKTAGYGRILLVEDHVDSATMIMQLLRCLGHEVQAVHSVAAALEAARVHSFDLLISDIGLPDGSGLDLLRSVRAFRPIKAIALSGYGRDEDIRQSMDAGFVEHLTKPVDLALLDKALKRAFAAGAPHQRLAGRCFSTVESCSLEQA